MRLKFFDKKLEDIYRNDIYIKKYPKDIIHKFIELAENIELIDDIRDIRNMKSLRLHKLKGNKKDIFSISLDKKWRLELKIEKDEQGNFIIIIKLSNHYK